MKRALSPSFLLLIGILILASLLRLHHLGSRPLYWDEPWFTVDVAAKPLSFIVTTNYGSNLYPLLLHFLMPLGDIATMARLPAAVFGILSVLLIFLIGRRLFSNEVAVLASLLLALSSHSLYFSQQARGYTGLLFFSLLSFYFFLKALEENKKLFWGMYGLALILGVYTHFFMLIIIPIHAAFVLTFFIESVLLKKKIQKLGIDGKRLAAFSLSVAVVIITCFLIFLPTKSQHDTLNFAPSLLESISNLFKGKMELNLFSFMDATIKRLLGYHDWAALFFVKLGILFIGAAGCLLRKRRELFLLSAYILFPFSLYVLSNSPSFFLPADNKFIFITPFLFLLIAKGLTSLVTGLVSAVSRLRLIQKPSFIWKTSFVFLLLVVCLLEGIGLEDYSFHFWKFRAPRMSKEARVYLRDHVHQGEVIYFDTYPNKNNMLNIAPVVYPGGKKKGVMIYEGGDYGFMASHLQDVGLWAILSREAVNKETLSETALSYKRIKILHLPQETILYHQAPRQTLSEKMTLVLEMLKSQAPSQDKKDESSFLLTKLHLLAKRNDAALAELQHVSPQRLSPPSSGRERQNAGILPANIKRILHPGKSYTQEMALEMLRDSVVELLIDNADHLSQAGNFEEALSLHKKVAELDPHNPRHILSLAEIFESCGTKEDAVRLYKKALALAPPDTNVNLIIRKLRNLLSLPSGYIIWNQGDTWRLRWWSHPEGEFQGSIRSSSPLKKVTKSRLARPSYFRAQKSRVLFKSTAAGGRIEGLDIRTDESSHLVFSLRINGRKDILNNIVLAVDDTARKRTAFR